MLKLIVVGLIFSTVSAAPIESTASEKSKNGDSPITNVFIRPSPINPDIPMDPKPPERIILDDAESDRDHRSEFDNDKSPSHGSHENIKNVHEQSEESKGNKSQRDNNHDEHSHEDHDDDSHEDHDDDSHENHDDDSHEDDHDPKRESDVFIVKSDLPLKHVAQPKEVIQPAKSGEPTIVYAIKADEKNLATDNFETSHRIPQIDEGERKFETSHHIPTHVEEDRTKAVANAKVEQKPK